MMMMPFTFTLLSPYKRNMPLFLLGSKIASPHVRSLAIAFLSAKPYSTFQPASRDSLPEIRDKLRGLGQGTIDFVPDYQPGVGLITLNNPTRHNAMSGVMMSQLADLTDKLENETADLAGIIVTGAMPAKAFCAGLGKKKKFIG
jgi:Enoyl-CoA hydratase/isomerase